MGNEKVVIVKDYETHKREQAAKDAANNERLAARVKWLLITIVCVIFIAGSFKELPAMAFVFALIWMYFSLKTFAGDLLNPHK